MGKKAELQQAADNAVTALRAVATSGVIPEVRAAASLAVLVILAVQALAPVWATVVAAQANEVPHA